LSGGLGNDTVDFVGVTTALEIDLPAGVATFINFQGDLQTIELTGIENAFGGDGDDQIFGGTGSETLSGGAGIDRLTGGFSADTFRFVRGDGDDVILDFAVGEDVLLLDIELGVSNAAEVVATATENESGDLRLVFNPPGATTTDSITLSGIPSSSASQLQLVFFDSDPTN
ncbi:MAG: M10 family metallopeptidase C-terminal domain-containing protein, partial [Pseudomonadota bacterium]